MHRVAALLQAMATTLLLTQGAACWKLQGLVGGWGSGGEGLVAAEQVRVVCGQSCGKTVAIPPA